MLIFNHKCLRNISRVFWDHRVNNTQVRNIELGKDGKSIDELVNLHQLRWVETCVTYAQSPPISTRHIDGVRVGWKKAKSDHPQSH